MKNAHIHLIGSQQGCCHYLNTSSIKLLQNVAFGFMNIFAYVRGTQRGYSSKPLNIAWLNVV